MVYLPELLVVVCSWLSGDVVDDSGVLLLVVGTWLGPFELVDWSVVGADVGISGSFVLVVTDDFVVSSSSCSELLEANVEKLLSWSLRVVVVAIVAGDSEPEGPSDDPPEFGSVAGSCESEFPSVVETSPVCSEVPLPS